MMSELGRGLVVFGVVMLVLGVMLQSGMSLPWLRWIGKLPGDIQVTFSNFRLLVPLGSGVVVSLVLSMVLQLVFRSR